MKKDTGIEELLKRHKIEPSARVKQSTLSQFADTLERRGRFRVILTLWKRSVPVYAVLIMIIASVGLSFYAGRSINRSGRRTRFELNSFSVQDTIFSKEISWHIAQADLL